MVIYLKHPQHGTKVASDQAEASYDESNGWTRFTPGQAKASPEPAAVAVEPDIREPDVQPAVVDAIEPNPGEAQTEDEPEPEKAEPTIEDLRALYKEKFGKAAHRNKTIATLKKDLGL